MPDIYPSLQLLIIKILRIYVVIKTCIYKGGYAITMIPDILTQPPRDNSRHGSIWCWECFEYNACRPYMVICKTPINQGVRAGNIATVRTNGFHSKEIARMPFLPFAVFKSKVKARVTSLNKHCRANSATPKMWSRKRNWAL